MKQNLEEYLLKRKKQSLEKKLEEIKYIENNDSFSNLKSEIEIQYDLIIDTFKDLSTKEKIEKLSDLNFKNNIETLKQKVQEINEHEIQKNKIKGELSDIEKQLEDIEIITSQKETETETFSVKKICVQFCDSVMIKFISIKSIFSSKSDRPQLEPQLEPQPEPQPEPKAKSNPTKKNKSKRKENEK